MRYLEDSATKRGLPTIGIGTYELQGKFPASYPRVGKRFILAKNIFERYRHMMTNTPIGIVLPQGGSWTDFEAYFYLMMVKEVARRIRHGEAICQKDEKFLIASGAIARRIKRTIEVYHLSSDKEIRKRVYLVEEKSVPQTLRSVIEKVLKHG